jgi:hypothetical protein
MKTIDDDDDDDNEDYHDDDGILPASAVKLENVGIIF